jgi:hypothetical protein
VGHRHLVIENLALKGWVIGAIRCGDGTGEQDHERAEAGAAAAGA